MAAVKMQCSVVCFGPRTLRENNEASVRAERKATYVAKQGWPHDLPVLSARGRSLFRGLHPLRILLLGCYSIAARLLQRPSRLYGHSLLGRASC